MALTAAAMVAFPGGAPYDTFSPRYLFFDNTFSDLGGLRTYTGRTNTDSRRLFMTALVVVGVSLALFGPTWKTWAAAGKAVRAGAVASTFALLSGAGFVATAFTPWDRSLDTHDTLVRVTFALLAGFIVCLTVVQIANRAPAQWIVANVAALLALLVYGLMQVLGPDLYTRDGLRLQNGIQKAIVYASILNLVVQAWGVRTAAAAASRDSGPAIARLESRERL